MTDNPAPEPRTDSDAERLVEVDRWLSEGSVSYGWCHDDIVFLRRLINERDTEIAQLRDDLTKEEQASIERVDALGIEIGALRDDFELAAARLRSQATSADLDGRDAELASLRVMADAAEEWYWAENRARLDTLGSNGRVFDALRLLGRYPPPTQAVQPAALPQPQAPSAAVMQRDVNDRFVREKLGTAPSADADALALARAIMAEWYDGLRAGKSGNATLFYEHIAAAIRAAEARERERACERAQIITERAFELWEAAGKHEMADALRSVGIAIIDALATLDTPETGA